MAHGRNPVSTGRWVPPRDLFGWVKILIATGFGLGFMPVAPATFACLLSLPVWFFLKAHGLGYAIIILALFATGVAVADDLSRTMGEDPRCIVIDEYACLLLPLYFTPVRIIPLAVTFGLFRFFDIVKPFPLRRLEDLPGGWGIMLDDLGAAIYTTAVILILQTVRIPFLV